MSEFELLGGDDDETRLLRDPVSGYSVHLPGHPRVITVEQELPRYDVVVTLDDVDVEHGFRIDSIPAQVDPQVLAANLATAYAIGRAKSPAKIKSIPIAFRAKSAPGGVAIRG